MAWTNPKTWSVGETLTAANFNTHVRDNLNAIGNHYRIRKATTESLTSNATPQNDDELLFAIGASETWQFQIVAGLTCGATGGIQYTFTVPAAATGTWNEFLPSTGLNNFGNAFGAFTNFATAVTSESMFLSGTCVNSATPGNVAFNWAQSVSNGTATSILINSWLIAHKIG